MTPLAIVQARIGSTRFPRKMLADLGGHPLIWWAWRAAVLAFGRDNVVIAMPASEENDELQRACRDMDGGVEVFRWGGDENDVLGRFHACANHYRWHPESIIVRITPDDPFKTPTHLRRVAEGERLPVETGGEAFTLQMLNNAHVGTMGAYRREHITWALFPTAPPKCPPGVWTVDTPEDLEAARAAIVSMAA